MAELEQSDKCVSRREFYNVIGLIVGIFVMMLMLMQVEVSTVKAEQKTYHMNVEKILCGVQKVDNDVDTLTKEIVQVKKDQP